MHTMLAYYSWIGGGQLLLLTLKADTYVTVPGRVEGRVNLVGWYGLLTHG